MLVFCFVFVNKVSSIIIFTYILSVVKLEADSFSRCGDSSLKRELRAYAISLC